MGESKTLVKLLFTCARENMSHRKKQSTFMFFYGLVYDVRIYEKNNSKLIDNDDDQDG